MAVICRFLAVICGSWWLSCTGCPIELLWTAKNYKYKDKDKDEDKDKSILRTPPKSNPRDLWPLRHLFRVMRRHDMTKKIDKDKYKDKYNDKDILRPPPKSNRRDLWPLKHLVRVMRNHDIITKLTNTKTITLTMRMTKSKTFWEYFLRAILETCDLCDIWSEWYW